MENILWDQFMPINMSKCLSDFNYRILRDFSSTLNYSWQKRPFTYKEIRVDIRASEKFSTSWSYSRTVIQFVPTRPEILEQKFFNIASPRFASFRNEAC